jgi:HD-like signal output (HDOD) protein/CheY-like chemotaxis protein
MDTKSILVAADPQVIVGITQALGPRWDATSVSAEADALAQLEQRSFDAFLVDFNLGSPDASQLLRQALEKRPEMIRFLLAYEADLALVAASVSGPHEILPKPIEPASLKSRIESGVAPHDSMHSQSGADPGTGTSASPSVPAVYAEVLKALDSRGVTKRQVGEIVAGDAALTSELLRLTNSAYLGLPRDITDPVEAVESMGLDTVRALVMALRFLAEHSQLKPGYLSPERIWQHSTHVAQLARDLVLFETKDRALAAEALVAGLLHDLGKVVLATNFDDLYGRVHSLGRKQPVALWDIEKEMFGASHGEIGGCLVGMWNMPSSVVEAAAFHHEPPLGENQGLTPLGAVHIANVLEHQLHPTDEFRVAPAIDTAFLNELGLLQRLPVWHAVFAERPAAQAPARPRRRVRAGSAKRRAASAAPKAEPAETRQLLLIPPVPSAPPPPRTANQLPAAPTAPTQTATSGQPESEEDMPVVAYSRYRRWVYAGAAAAVLGLMTLWLGTRSDQPIRALAPAPTTARAPVVASPAPVPETDPAAVLGATPAMAVSEEDPTTASTTASDPEPFLPNPEPTVLAPAAVPEPAPAFAVSEDAPATVATTAPNPVPSLPKSAPTVAPAPQMTATIAQPPTLTPEKKAQPEFRLSGIVYSVRRPSAIVNGQTVYVGDRVSGATIVGIDRTQVTLQINGQRKTYALR